jgi:hypothetical protein
MSVVIVDALNHMEGAAESFWVTSKDGRKFI